MAPFIVLQELVMNSYDGIIDAIMVVLGAVIGWAMRLESKTNVNIQRHEDLLTLINEKFAGMTQHIDDGNEALDRRLERVERHVLNGHYTENK